MHVDHPVISADSHVTEAPNTYIDYIDPKYVDIAPRVVTTNGERGDVYVIDGMKQTIAMGLVASAGRQAEEITTRGSWDDIPRSGYDATYRIADQDLDGVSCEVIYPSVGLVLCNHPDPDYKQAAMDAYNRWIAEYCSVDPNRLIGVGQTPMRSPEEGIRDLEAMKALGLRAVMLTGIPEVEDYDSPCYDEFWQASIELAMVPSFHVLTAGSADGGRKPRGPKLNSFMGIIRANQDIMGMLCFGGVFARNPELKVVCVEADAGWVPHYMYRMDHAFDRHRNYLASAVDRPPSHYFRENIFLTFQDDHVAFLNADQMNWKRLCWANDFPHSDSTWPDSQELLNSQAAHLTPEQKRAILCDNTAGLYGIDLSTLPIGGESLAAAGVADR